MGCGCKSLAFSIQNVNFSLPYHRVTGLVKNLIGNGNRDQKTIAFLHGFVYPSFIFFMAIVSN